jgi:cytochrome c-type biogenesis protein CcmF
MDLLGRFALTLGLGLAVYGAAAAVLGASRGRPLLVESARTTAYSLAAVVAAANGAMLAALLANDFSIAYVALNSSRATPTFFKVLALWSADEGSLLLWNLVLAGFIAAVAFRFRKRQPDTFPWALAVLYAVAVFYLALVVGPANPFSTVASPPIDGRGPLPLLQNHPLMAVHPPLLYLGFIGLTVPFAFAMGAVVSGHLSDRWIRVTRRWTLVAWIFLTAGLVLGALWSYGVLGWGGYWAWDPVENVALLPWLTATAFLHSVMLQERRGMLKAWNLSLAVATFALVTLGTFLTRGSILASVHAFAQSLVGPMYLGFLVLILLAGFGGVAWRSWRLGSEGRLDGALSREAAFVGNNLLLVAVTFVVLVGTIFPLAVEALTGRQITVGEPYFTESTVPLFLLLLFLMGVGVVLPWRRAEAQRVRSRLAGPAVAGGAVMVAVAVAGAGQPAAVAALGLAAFVVAANGAELARGLRAHARATGRSGPAGAMAAVTRNRRLYGGLIAHVGIALAAVAVTVSSAFGSQREVTLARGQEATIDGYVLRYEGPRFLEQPHRDVVVADVSVVRGGSEDGVATPSLNLYPGASQPIGTPAVRYGVIHDLYVSVLGFEGTGQRATFRMFVNPGVTWLWIGGAIVVLGGVVAVLPERRRGAALPMKPVPSAGRAVERVS